MTIIAIIIFTVYIHTATMNYLLINSMASVAAVILEGHRRTVGDRAFTAAGPTLWNSLPHDITDCVTDVILQETENLFVFYIISMTTFFFLMVLEVFT